MKSKGIAAELLAKNSQEHLLSLLKWCSKDSFWRTLFKQSKYPVNRFAKSLPTIQEQAADLKPKQREQSVRADMQTAITCSKCDGAGEIVSTHLKGKKITCPGCMGRKAV